MAKLFFNIETEMPVDMTREKAKDLISSGFAKIVGWSKKHANENWYNFENLKAYFCKFNCFFMDAQVKGTLLIRENKVQMHISVYDVGAPPEIKELIGLIWDNDDLNKRLETLIKNNLESALDGKYDPIALQHLS